MKRHDCARIDAARQEGADRHVADHVLAHRAAELGTHQLDPVASESFSSVWSGGDQ
jgi:hypothetical protein